MANPAQARVYRSIKRFLTSNVVSDHVSINARHFAHWLSVSPVPVREALIRISQEGIIDFVPERGFFVREHSYADLQHIWGIAEAIATATLNPEHLAGQLNSLFALRTFTDRSCSTRSRQISRRYMLWHTEGLARRVVQLAFPRQPRSCLISVLDKTLLFRQLTAEDECEAVRVATLLRRIVYDLADAKWRDATNSIQQMIREHAQKLGDTYPRYALALAESRRRGIGALSFSERRFKASQEWPRCRADAFYPPHSFDIHQ